MDISIFWWIIFCLIGALVSAVAVAFQLNVRLRQELFRRRSQSSKYGKITEQFLPLVDSFPWDPSNFRFLGTPIDGMQFAEDRIILVEFKTANSQLSSAQRRIRTLVDEGKVDFEVIRVS